MIRKLIIAVSAVLVVLAAFVIYTKIVKTAPIVPQQSFRDEDPLKTPEFSNRAQIAGNHVGDAGKSWFVTPDPVTRKPVRIFGFDKLLNPEENSDKWRLENPYMEFFGNGFNCKVRAKKGNAEIETVLGKPAPQNAQLYDDVRIEITFDKEGSKSEGVIYLEDMDYDSERSEISTNNSVRAEFADATMVGKGMVLIYNSAEARIEFFELIDLDYIKVKNVENLSKDDDAKGKINSEKHTESFTKTDGGNTQVNENAVSNDVAPAKNVTKSEVDDILYQCRFRKDVTIEYSDELVVVGRTSININNILFNSKTSKSKKNKADIGKPAQTANADIGEPAKTSNTETTEKNESADTTEVALDSDSPGSGKKTVAHAAKGKEAIITCDGGFIIEPMDNVMIKEDAKKAGVVEVLRLEAGLKNPVVDTVEAVAPQKLISAETAPEFQMPEPQPEYAYFATDESPRKPTRFHAERIDYDMTTGNAFAKGPIKLLIYNASKVADSSSLSSEPGKQIPVNITASENVEYFSEKNQAVFNGNVVGTRVEQQADSITRNNLYGDKLIVDLKSSDTVSGGSAIRHLTVLGEEVILDSEKKDGETILSKTKLFCDYLDYDSDMEMLTATGPGKIEINNANAPAKEGEPAGDMSLGGPCYAWIENFDFLEWSTSSNRVVADAASESMIMQYVPLVDGKPGNALYAVASRIEADFMQTFDGRTRLAMLTAKDGITFNEEEGNAFEGDRLYYTANSSILQINGTTDELCKVNGMPIEKIRYNLKTRELITRIAGTGTFSTDNKE